jgi:hypothetical protein
MRMFIKEQIRKDVIEDKKPYKVGPNKLFRRMRLADSYSK